MSDTTREAVERVLDGLRGPMPHVPEIGGVPSILWGVSREREAAADTLTAILARAEAAEARADEWRNDYKALSAAIVGDTGLSAMLVATQARLFRPRAEAAEVALAAMTVKRDAERETVARLTEAIELAILWCGNANVPKSAIATELTASLTEARRAALTEQKDRTDG